MPPQHLSASEIQELPDSILLALHRTRAKVVRNRKFLKDLKPDPYRSLVHSADCTSKPKGACYYRMRDLYDAHLHSLVAGKKWHKAQEITDKLLQVLGGHNDLCHSCAQVYMRLYNGPFASEVEEMESEAKAALAAQKFPDVAARDELGYWIA